MGKYYDGCVCNHNLLWCRNILSMHPRANCSNYNVFVKPEGELSDLWACVSMSLFFPWPGILDQVLFGWFSKHVYQLCIPMRCILADVVFSPYKHYILVRSLVVLAVSKIMPFQTLAHALSSVTSCVWDLTLIKWYQESKLNRKFLLCTLGGEIISP